MIYRDEVQRMDVGPELAQLWLDERYWPGNRKLREDWVATYAEEMLADTFGYAEVAFVHTPSGIWLANGQHTLKAIVRSGRVVRFTVTDFHATEDRDIGIVYSRLDRGGVRRVGDSVRARGLDKELNLCPTWCKVLQGAVVPLADGFRGDKTAWHGRLAKSHDLRMEIMEMWSGEAAALRECTLGADRHIIGTIQRAAVTAVALVTLRFKPEEASAFWKRIATNDGLAAGQPDHKLVWWLAHNSVAAQGNGIQARAVASCWNAWIECRSLDKLYTDKTRPIRLVGTPYTGKEAITYGDSAWRSAYPEA